MNAHIENFHFHLKNVRGAGEEFNLQMQVQLSVKTVCISGGLEVETHNLNDFDPKHLFNPSYQFTST